MKVYLLICLLKIKTTSNDATLFMTEQPVKDIPKTQEDIIQKGIEEKSDILEYILYTSKNDSKTESLQSARRMLIKKSQNELERANAAERVLMFNISQFFKIYEGCFLRERSSSLDYIFRMNYIHFQHCKTDHPCIKRLINMIKTGEKIPIIFYDVVLNEIATKLMIPKGLSFNTREKEKTQENLKSTMELLYNKLDTTQNYFIDDLYKVIFGFVFDYNFSTILEETLKILRRIKDDVDDMEYLKNIYFCVYMLQFNYYAPYYEGEMTKWYSKTKQATLTMYMLATYVHNITSERKFNSLTDKLLFNSTVERISLDIMALCFDWPSSKTAEVLTLDIDVSNFLTNSGVKLKDSVVYKKFKSFLLIFLGHKDHVFKEFKDCILKERTEIGNVEHYHSFSLYYELVHKYLD
ncbi:hypothetical protein NGRA_0679 [Nosema granulosis]|uniref:Uncharacterized protein n=1 Tax=Nosema granulosis TaxID=83296 RepID=A0A9P6H0X6_9MICR|nr:hypothetical protein NGRA_0679 [Nosema granulosis]